VIDFRTPNELPPEISLTLVKLRNKEIVYLSDLILEEWDNFSEIPCDEEITMAFRNGQIVYCIDKAHPLYGQQVKIIFSTTAEDPPLFEHLIHGYILNLRLEQVSEHPPPPISKTT
jgi:hypothetical protein